MALGGGVCVCVCVGGGVPPLATSHGASDSKGFKTTMIVIQT